MLRTKQLHACSANIHHHEILERLFQNIIVPYMLPLLDPPPPNLFRGKEGNGWCSGCSPALSAATPRHPQKLHYTPFTDFGSAFNTIQHLQGIKTLQHLQVLLTLIYWTHKFVSNRDSEGWPFIVTHHHPQFCASQNQHFYILVRCSLLWYMDPYQFVCQVNRSVEDAVNLVLHSVYNTWNPPTPMHTSCL